MDLKNKFFIFYLSLKFAVLSAISLGCLCDCAAYNYRDFLFLIKLKTDFVLGSVGALEAVVKRFINFHYWII
jgi:hypothetical protein